MIAWAMQPGCRLLLTGTYTGFLAMFQDTLSYNSDVPLPLPSLCCAFPLNRCTTCTTLIGTPSPAAPSGLSTSA
jgi:hypothetical protein